MSSYRSLFHAGALAVLSLAPCLFARSDPAPATPAPPAALRRDLPAPRLLSRGALLSRHAMSFRSARYRFGSANPWSTDCSGLTMQLYRSVGISLPHSARAQFHYGKRVTRAELMPGDLLFFNTRGGISHVGMYIGNHRMIHAANPRRGIRIESLSAPYYAHRYVGARRLLPEGARVPETPPGAIEGHGEPFDDEAAGDSPSGTVRPDRDPEQAAALAGTARVAGGG